VIQEITEETLDSDEVSAELPARDIMILASAAGPPQNDPSTSEFATHIPVTVADNDTGLLSSEDE
jgi:hypothetical protein